MSVIEMVYESAKTMILPDSEVVILYITNKFWPLKKYLGHIHLQN